MKAAVVNALIAVAVSVLTVTTALVAYDRWVLRPSLIVGVVDLQEVYRAKEAQFMQLMMQTGGDEERQQALAMARSFSQRLPVALDELPRECACLVVLKAAVAGGPNAVDLTPALRRKVDLR